MEEHDNTDKADFNEVLENEYADDQIGDVEVEVDQDGIIPQELLDEAVNEFIESQKIRDRKLYKDFSDKPIEAIPQLKPKNEIEGEHVESEKDREEIISKQYFLYFVRENNRIE